MSNAIAIYKITLTYKDGTVFTERVPKTEKTDVVGRKGLFFWGHAYRAAPFPIVRKTIRKIKSSQT